VTVLARARENQVRLIEGQRTRGRKTVASG